VLSVGQLGPDKSVEVVAEVVMPLSMIDGVPFLRIPTTVGQLYGASARATKLAASLGRAEPRQPRGVDRTHRRETDAHPHPDPCAGAGGMVAPPPFSMTAGYSKGVLTRRKGVFTRRNYSQKAPIERARSM
jgi:hypothetical protein